jgi:hypothetical protein
MQGHGERATAQVPELSPALDEVDHAALAEQDVVVQLARQLRVQLHRHIMEPDRYVAQVVRADGMGIARCIAAAQPALLDHRNVAEPMLARQMIGRRQAMPAGTDDDNVVLPAQRRTPPSLRPALVAGKRVAGERQKRVALHGLPLRS